jgi:hypothetical protein
MQKPTDVRTFVIGAEQAQARGDHGEAERLLRRALVLQESSLGAEHFEVAKTLNNLAIVCEMNGRLSDAETCYRRAYAIAVSKLAPTDPFLVTSRENLEQFCQARGLPFNSRSAPPRSSPPAPTRPSGPPPRVAAPSGTLPRTTASPPKSATAPRTATTVSASHTESIADLPLLSETAMSPRSTPPTAVAPPKPLTPSQTATTTRAAHPVTLADMPFRSEAARPSAPARVDATLPMTHSAVPVFAAERGPWRAIILGLAAFVLVIAAWYWFASSGPPERAALSPVATSGTPAPAEPSPSEPAPVPAAESKAAAPPAAEPTAPPPAAVATDPAVATAPQPPTTTLESSSVTVVNAEACRSLTRSNAWTCTPATGSQAPGTIYFYTRVASPRDTTIEHRWYRDDQLAQRVPLRIRASPEGFRTYSQIGISPDRAGSWKVELRTADGHVLGEDTFEIRP